VDSLLAQNGAFFKGEITPEGQEAIAKFNGSKSVTLSQIAEAIGVTELTITDAADKLSAMGLNISRLAADRFFIYA
jgi:DNA-binding MarR family transcriptional regulator